ncbi:PAS domain-containing protein [Methylomonas sp. LL1]|uniref:sensor histidine kinase n=1 Tax=Methylomonas sp. LL1 TaxID=2785785 RepID=UPI0018C3E79F|nr:ATP-binding protein [Methylomonas sp. LL1]QPK65402.1 PAS domain-containing protein [Methylomonas sp. LL1]
MNIASQQQQQKAERLTDAFRVFNQLSENLALSYQGLQEQVANLNRQLAAARGERLATLIEKETLASRLQQILAALPAAVLVLNAEGRIIDCNNRAITFLGEPLLGQPWQTVVERSLLPVPDSPHECRLQNGRIVNISLNQLGNDAEQIILLSDVSELHALQDTLAQQKHLSAMGEMVAGLAHQIRTPLATAILYASQLTQPKLPQEKRQQFAEKILERLHYLERQVNDMLIFAKQGRLAKQGFALSRMLERIGERMDEFPGVFLLDNQLSEARLFGNEDALGGALLNLLNNAVEAGANVISLIAAQTGRNIEIRIRDNGSGIDNAGQKLLFEPFYTTKTHGTGLGLAVVDSVVKAHGGSVSCQSELEQGSVFTVSLPLIQPELGLSSAGLDRQSSEVGYEAV